MICESLVIYCGSCAAWYTRDEVNWFHDHADNVTEHDPCRCGSDDLMDAHATGHQTPWQAMKAEFVQAEIDSLNKRIASLERQLEEELSAY